MSSYQYRESHVNSLAPGKFEWKFRYVVFKPISVVDGWGISWNCPNMNVTGLWSVNTGSGNGLVHPLPEPMLTQISLPYGVTRPQWVSWPSSNYLQHGEIPMPGKTVLILRQGPGSPKWNLCMPQVWPAVAHCGLVMLYGITDLCQHSFKLWLGTCLVQSHYLNQCWLIVNWTIRIKLQRNSNH